LGDTNGIEREGADTARSNWDDVEFISCRDGKARPVKPGLCLLVDGLSARLADGTEIGKKEVSRVMMLRGLGNAIVPQLAAEFVKSFMEVLE
jgi:DNA (cytosine-5)-methyltransferase 1